MKKIFLTTTLGFLATCGFAQGTIVFNNDVARAVTTNGYSSGVVQTTMTPRAVVYYSTAAVAPAVPSFANNFDFTGWTLGTSTGFPTFFGAVNSGRFAGGAVTLDAAVGGSSPWMIVAGWTGGFASWTAAYNAALAGGNSQVGVTPTAWAQPTGSPNGAPPTSAVAMVLGPNGFNGLVLGVPEPSTIALCGLGGIAAAFFAARRRRG